jgi:hypothetical protein
MTPIIAVPPPMYLVKVGRISALSIGSGSEQRREQVRQAGDGARGAQGGNNDQRQHQHRDGADGNPEGFRPSPVDDIKHSFGAFGAPGDSRFHR